MTFRRHGKPEHNDARTWDVWKGANAALLARCGLPAGVVRSRRDRDYLLKYGYWCDGAFAAHVNKVDFDLAELTPAQVDAFRALLSATLSDDEKQRGSAAWHFVCPPPPWA